MIRELKQCFALLLTRRKLRFAFLKLLFLCFAIAVTLFFISRFTRKQRLSNNAIVSEDSSAHKSVIKSELSAKQKAIFAALNPVVDGWGEMGKAVVLTDSIDKQQSESLFKQGAFNVFISNRIAFNRSLADPRPKECSNLHYDIDNLGTASVIIIFTDEIWSALLRTIVSVWNRTPNKLLKEIILVDDWSTKKELKQDLVDYCSYYFGDKVKILRTKKRDGLIRARILGAKKAKGDVLVYLDSHCEVTKDWILPLMKAIKNDSSTVVCPVIDVIDDKTLEYSMGNPYYFQIGGFSWSGHFNWIDVPMNWMIKNPTKAIESPTMAGGLFAIDRKYFFSMGAYDDKMEIWGGENLELSFRIWQCGGRLEIHPCSHVGHIFRDFHPYSFLGKDTHAVNTLRTFLVWMDDKYLKYFFMHRKDLKSKPAGDLSERFKLKKQLNCKSFSWYLEHVYRNRKYMFDVDATAYGYVYNPKTNLCFDTLNENEDKQEPMGLYICTKTAKTDEWTNQFFSYMKNGFLRREDHCLTADETQVRGKTCFFDVNDDDGEKNDDYDVEQQKMAQLWEHTKGGSIMNLGTKTCITTKGSKSGDRLALAPCDPNDLHQIWWFQRYTDITVL